MAECCIIAHKNHQEAISEKRLANSDHEVTITSETLTDEFQNDIISAVVGGTRAGGRSGCTHVGGYCFL